MRRRRRTAALCATAASRTEPTLTHSCVTASARSLRAVRRMAWPCATVSALPTRRPRTRFFFPPGVEPTTSALGFCALLAITSRANCTSSSTSRRSLLAARARKRAMRRLIRLFLTAAVTTGAPAASLPFAFCTVLLPPGATAVASTTPGRAATPLTGSLCSSPTPFAAVPS